MKITLATATLMISLLGAGLTAAETTPTTAFVEQQFQQADVQLAVVQYKKLRMAAFEIALKLQTETTQSDQQRKHLELMHAELQERAEQLRAQTLKVAAVAVANSR